MIGEAIERTEDDYLVRGAGQYVDDIQLPQMLSLAFVRSEHASARILRIDMEDAKKMPGVHAILTVDDLPELRDSIPPPVMNAMTIKHYRQSALADGVVRFVGEPVVAVVAESQYLAADAAEAVVIEYEPLTPVVDVEAALGERNCFVHPSWNTNLAGEISAEVGDADEALASSDVVIEERFDIGRMSGLPLETRGVVAAWDELSAMMTVWTSTQVPYGVREYIMSALDLERTAIRVIAPDVGGGFGPKASVYGEDIVAAAASRLLKRPVKWVETRRESLMATVHGHDQVHWARLGLMKDGRFTVLDDHFLIDNGAYLPRGARTANNVLAHLMGPYRFPTFRCHGEVVVTNKTPTIPFRGAGRLQAVYVTERLIQRAAERLNLDPVELKRVNLLGAEELPLDRKIPYRPNIPVIYDSGDYPFLLSTVEEMIGYRSFRMRQSEAKRQGRLLGCAIALFTEGTGVPPAEGAMVSVNERGRVTVSIGAASQGQSHQTTMAQICAETLSIPFKDVAVVAGDTARFPASPVSSGTFASRIAAISGPAIALAATEVKEKACKIAAELLECAPEDLQVENGRVHIAGIPESGVSLAEIALAAKGSEFLGEQAEPGLTATRYYVPESVTWAAGAHGAVVEVDPDTGAVTVIDYAVAHDVGREINPVVVEGQVHGGVAQGLGSALLEEIVYDESGQLMTGTLMDYALPHAASFPAFESQSVPSPSTVNALGVKGAGEGGAIPGQAIIANAIADALGVDGPELNRMPIHPDRVMSLLERSHHEPKRT